MAILLQICLVYWMSAVEKFDPSWRIDGSALRDALGIQSLTRPAADWLLAFPALLKVSTHAVLLIEEAGPLAALLIPLRSRWRLAGPVAVILLHLGIACFFSFGVFPWVAISAWLLFFPPCAWDGVERCLGKGASRLGLSRPVCAEGAVAMGNDAIAVEDPQGRTARAVLNFVPLLLIALVVWWNLARLPLASGGIGMPDSLRRATRILHLNQHWYYFAPRPNTREGRYEITAQLRDGSQATLHWDASPAPADPPPSLRNLYPDKRWRQHLSYLFHSRKPALIESYAEWLRKSWERAHPENPVEDLAIDFLLRDNRHPEDGLSRVRMYPVVEVSDDGRAIFPGDTRRNQRDAEREEERKSLRESVLKP